LRKSGNYLSGRSRRNGKYFSVVFIKIAPQNFCLTWDVINCLLRKIIYIVKNIITLKRGARVDEKAVNTGSRRERKKEETRQKIIDVAMELFRERGFHATTMEQIAGLVDVSKVTIYNYFPVREAIINECMQAGNRKRKEEEIPRLIEDFPDTRSRLMELFRRSLEWMTENREIYKVYFGYRMQNLCDSFRDQSKRSGFEGVLAMIISAGQETGEIKRRMSAELLARHLEMMSGAAFMPWWADPDNFSLEKNLGPTIDLFLYGAKRKVIVKK